MARINYRAQDFIDAIPNSAGIISTIAARVGCDWHTAKRYITEYPTVMAAYTDECEKVVDVAETAVIKAMTEGDVHTAKWYLTMKGRARGYAKTQRTEVTGADGEAVKVEDSTSVERRIDEALALLDLARARAALVPSGGDSGGRRPGGQQYPGGVDE